MSTNKLDTHSNPAVSSDPVGSPGGMRGPVHGQHDAIEVCNTDDLRREKALRESSLRVPR